MLLSLSATLETALDEVASLIHLNLASHPDFVDRTLAWFVGASGRTLQVPTHVRSAIAREAAFAAASRKGYKDPTLPPQLRGRSAQAATLALCLARTEATLQDEARSTRSRLQDARDKLVQLLAVASRTDPISLEDGQDPQLQALNIWRAVASNGADTKAMVAYLRFAISPADRVQLIAQILSQAGAKIGAS